MITKEFIEPKLSGYVEPCAVKVASTVPRGGNGPPLQRNHYTKSTYDYSLCEEVRTSTEEVEEGRRARNGQD